MSLKAFFSLLLFFPFFCFAQFGNVLNFDGVNDDVNLNAKLLSNTDATEAYTIEAWIKTDTGDDDCIVCQYDFPGANRFQFQIRGDKLNWWKGISANSADNTIDIRSTKFITDDKWHHVAGTRDENGVVKLYIDGVQDGEGIDNLPFVDFNSVIGERIANTQGAFKGNIDEVRIWNTARTQAEIQANRCNELSGLEEGLIAYYNFNQGIPAGDNGSVMTLMDATPNRNDGRLNQFALFGEASNWLAAPENSTLVAYYPFNGNANDESGNENDGVVNGATLTTDRFGNIDAAYLFDGTDDFIDAPHSELINFERTDPFAISVWIKAAENQTDLLVQGNDIISKWFENNTNRGIGYPFTIRITNQNADEPGQVIGATFDGYGNCNNGFSTQAMEYTAVNDDEWHHVLIQRRIDNGVSYLQSYVDGQLENEVVEDLVCSTKNTAPLRFGKRGGPNFQNHFKGAIDDIGIYCRTLTTEEIEALYDLEKDPLIAHYPFNGNANDESGNGNDGVVNGATLAADRFGNPNSAYQFDGVDDFIEVMDTEALRLGDSDYTISLWAYIDEYTDPEAHAFLSKRSSLEQEGYLFTTFGNNRLDSREKGKVNFVSSGATNPSIESESTLIEKEWYNITLVASITENKTKLYINGSLDKTTSYLRLNPNASANLFIGKDELTDVGDFICCDGFHFNGLLDDILIYCTALSEEEVLELYTPAEKEPLVAFYPFNGNANDESGNGNDGAVNGAMLAADRFGNPNSAYRFDGVDDFIQIEDNANLRLGNTSYSISLWANISAFTNTQAHAFLSKRNGFGGDGYLYYTAGTNQDIDLPQGSINFIASGSDNPFITSEANLLTSEWYHIVLVGSKEDGTSKVYVNGELDKTDVFLPLNPKTTADLFIGRDELTAIGDFICCDGYYFNGLLDDISIYCEALTEEEIAALYQPAPVDGKATVQLIHNVEAQNAILRINGEVLVNNARYRSATPYLELEAGEYEIDIVPLGAGEIFSTAISVAPNRTYQLVANGTFDINDDYPIEIAILESAKSSSDSDKVDIQFHNGSAGSTALSLQNQGDLLFEQVEFGEFGNDYVSLMANNYLFELLSSGNTIESFLARLKRRGGKSALIFASGSIEANSKGLWIAFSDGKTFPLTRISQSAAVEQLIESRASYSNVSISPNPTSGRIRFVFEDYSDQDVTISLYNSLGQEISELFNGQIIDKQFILKIDLSQLEKGIYYVKIQEKSNQKSNSIQAIIIN